MRHQRRENNEGEEPQPTPSELGQSLTSVSRQLMALEEFLGTTLVERTTRHLSLTLVVNREHANLAVSHSDHDRANPVIE